MALPASKRLKLDGCLICNNSPQFTKKREAYTELLINHLLPPSQRDKANNNKDFDFCIPCSDILENLFQLKEGLEFILNSIKTTVESIKISMLKNGSSGNFLVDNFRRLAVNDYCPKVRMYKNNSLIKIEKKTETKKVAEDMDLESPSNGYSYEEYDEPMSVETVEDSENGDDATNQNSEEIVKTSSYSSKPSSIVNGDSSNSSTSSDSSQSKTAIPSELKKPTSNNLEDSIITVYEPPKFSSTQWQVYYENYKDMYKCKFCSTIMKGENLNASLARHINVIHAKNCRFKCAICFAIFFSKSKCRSHIGECHYEMFNMKPPKIDKEKEKAPEPVLKPIGVIPGSSYLRSGPSAESTLPGMKRNSVARKKTGMPVLPKSVTENPPSEPYAGEQSSSSTGKFSDDKIRSGVIINIEPKSRYNLIEDIVKFEPWDETSREFLNTSESDPLTKSPEMIPTEESPEETKDDKDWSRPMLSYAQLAILAIKNIESNHKKSATLSEVCNFICTHYPYFKTDTDFRRKIQQAMTSASRKYFKCHAEAVESSSPTLKPNQPKEKKVTRVYTINDDALNGQHEIFQAAFNESAYAMAYPERVNAMIENLWAKRIPTEEECVITDSIDIEEGIGVKIDTDAETPTPTADSPSPSKKSDDAQETPEVIPEEPKTILRPSLSYCHLSYLALANIKMAFMKTEDVNEYIKETFSFYKHFSGQWRNQVSKALSTNNCFERHGTGPYRWKIDVTNMTTVREELKNSLMKSVLNFYFSLANPNKMEEILVNALGDEIDLDFIKNCIKDYLSQPKEGNQDKAQNNEMVIIALKDVQPPPPEDQDNAMDAAVVEYVPESESITELGNVEGDDDIVEIDRPRPETPECQDSDSDSDDQDASEPGVKKIKIGNVVGQYKPPPPPTPPPPRIPPRIAPRILPVSVVSLPIISRPMPGSRPVAVVSVPQAPSADKESVIEIVEEGSGYFYRVDDENTFTFVMK